jgi:hypothetical protein
MPVSIEELDATVRAFYEGRGEQVCYWELLDPSLSMILTFRFLRNSKRLLKLL